MAISGVKSGYIFDVDNSKTYIVGRTVGAI